MGALRYETATPPAAGEPYGVAAIRSRASAAVQLKAAAPIPAPLTGSKYSKQPLRRKAPVAQQPDLPSEVGIVGRCETALSICAEILAWIEAETRRMADRTGLAPAIFGEMRLRRVFDEQEAMPVGEC